MRWMIAIGLILATSVAQADDVFRCGINLVQVGDSVLEVEDNCGPPQQVAPLVNEFGEQVGIIWYYRGDFGKADREVTFSSGRVIRIERLVD